MITIDDSNDMIITLSMARDCFQGCPTGWQQFAERYNYDWKEVVRHGIKASELNQIDDIMAKELIEYAYKGKV